MWKLLEKTNDSSSDHSLSRPPNQIGSEPTYPPSPLPLHASPLQLRPEHIPLFMQRGDHQAGRDAKAQQRGFGELQAGLDGFGHGVCYAQRSTSAKAPRNAFAPVPTPLARFPRLVCACLVRVRAQPLSPKPAPTPETASPASVAVDTGQPWRSNRPRSGHR
jgi:hypothetical protein